MGWEGGRLGGLLAGGRTSVMASWVAGNSYGFLCCKGQVGRWAFIHGFRSCGICCLRRGTYIGWIEQKQEVI